MSSTYNQADGRYDLGQYQDLSVERFVLDVSTLDTDGIGLDGPSPAFILGESTLDGVGKLDGFTFTTEATAAAQLGAASVSATATVTHTAQGAASLGALQAAATATVIDELPTAAAALGGLAAAATATRTTFATGAASLGDLSGVGSGVVTVTATATATLGTLTAAGTGTVIDELPVASAALGALTATATSEQPEPPTPPPAAQPTGRPRMYSTQPRHKLEPVVEQVPEIVPTKPQRIPSTVSGICVSRFAGLSASASGMVTFSAEEDDLQVLLLI
jgi:hypothetical protein